MAGTEAGKANVRSITGPIQDPRSEVAGEQRREPNVKISSGTIPISHRSKFHQIVEYLKVLYR